MNNDDIIIDYHHLYNIILDKLLKVFPKSRTGFKFEEIYREADLNSLETDDSYYWFQAFQNFNHSEFIRHFLKRDGIIEDSNDNGNDSKLTDKGLKIVEVGSFEKYITLKERQEKLELEFKETALAVQKSTLETNKSIIKTNEFQRLSLLASLVLSVVTLLVVWYTGQVSNNNSERTLKVNEQTFELQRQDFLFRQNQDSLSRILQSVPSDSTYREKKVQQN